MSTYCPITKTQMEEALDVSKGWYLIPPRNLPTIKEYVYEIRSRKNRFAVRIFSSIRVGDTQVRQNGGDSIKVCALLLKEDGSIERGLLKSTRVFRVEGWHDNLLKAARKVWRKAVEICEREGFTGPTGFAAKSAPGPSWTRVENGFVAEASCAKSDPSVNLVIDKGEPQKNDGEITHWILTFNFAGQLTTYTVFND